MSWAKTREMYLHKATAVRKGSVVLLPEAPRHVPVLCLDLEYMLGEIEDYEHTKAALRTRPVRGPGEPNDMEEVIGRLQVGLRTIEGALADLTTEMEATLAKGPRQRDLFPLVWNLRNLLTVHYGHGPDGTHQWAHVPEPYAPEVGHTVRSKRTGEKMWVNATLIVERKARCSDVEGKSQGEGEWYPYADLERVRDTEPPPEDDDDY